jgi:predicted  nucleic acid-binding Zn-ribbon protein
VKEELELLIRLQSLDSLIAKKESQRGGVTTAIKNASAEVEEKKKELALAEERLKTLEKERRDKESTMDELAHRITDRKGKLFQVKDNKEYTAMLKEIETYKEEIDRYEEEVIVLLDDIANAQEELAKAKDALSLAQKHLEEAKGEGEKEKKRLESELAQIREERERIAQAIPPRFMRLYQRIVKSKNGIAVVRAEDGACRGCNMELPPQHFVEVKKGEEVLQCPFCQRIIYYWEEPKGEEEE